MDTSYFGLWRGTNYNSTAASTMPSKTGRANKLALSLIELEIADKDLANSFGVGGECDMNHRAM